MGAFFDSRKFLRTPGFAQEGLYDDPDQGLPPLPDRIARPDEQPSPMGLSGMLAAAPSEPSQMREIPQQQPSQPMSRPLPPRERITLPDAPLPPKVGKMRQILGTAAELYLPQVGQEIRQPGYDRAQKEYGNKVAKLQMEAKLNEAAAQQDFHVANSRAAMARAEASNAQRDRTRAQMSTDGGFDLAPGHVRFGRDGGTPIANNPLPPKTGDAGVKIGRDGRPYFEEGEKFTTLPPAVASSVITSSKPQNKPTTQMDYEAIVRGQNPDISDIGLSAEVAKMMKADRDAKLKLTGAQTDRANRPPKDTSPGADFRQTQTMSKAYKNEGPVKQFYEVDQAYKAIADSVAAANSDKSGVGDVTLMRYFAKLTDPTTGVREGEYATMQGAGGAMNALKNFTSGNWVQGQTLTPETRAAFLKMAGQVRANRATAMEGVKGKYRRQATKFNADPNLIFDDDDTPSAPTAPKKDPLGIR